MKEETKEKIIEILRKLIDSQKYDYYTLNSFAEWIISETEKPIPIKEN